MGMGLGFQDLTPQQTSVLTGWLNNEHGEDISASEGRTAAKQVDSTDRVAALNLFRQLLSKGILTQTDLMDMIVNQSVL